MKPYIEYIGVIDNKKKVHAVHFKQGLNIVTGKSSTGKSALIEIFDYCFGSADYTVPVGKITKNTSLYFIVLKFQTHSTVIARKPNESKGFIKEVKKIKKIKSSPYFASDFFEIDRFIRLDIFKKELGTLFGLDITDTDTNLETVKYRRQKSPAPSIRSFTSFMLQHQNLIANKHAIFYRFDQKEKKDQAIEHFKILLGYADQDFFLLSQKLNELEIEQRRISHSIPKKEQEDNAKLQRLDLLLRNYQAISGMELIEASTRQLINNPYKWLEIIREIRPKVDSSSDKNTLQLNSLKNKRLELLASLRDLERKDRNIESSINYSNKFSNTLDNHNYPQEITESITTCPICDSHTNILEKESNSLNDAITWLNKELITTPHKLAQFKSEKNKIGQEISPLRESLKKIDTEIELIIKENKEISQRESLLETVQKSKLHIELYLEHILDNSKKSNSLEDELKDIKKKIHEINQQLKQYDIKNKLSKAELSLAKTMNKIGNKLDFEKSYKPINLHFSLDTFDLWQMMNNKKVFLRSMGSGANWLYCHLVLFMALHKLFCEEKKCVIPPILFIDQPTQVYFPNIVDDKKKFDKETINPNEDIQSVEKFFSEIISFCETTKEKTGITPQIIVTDHADNLTLKDGKNFEDYVRARWRGKDRGFIR